MAVGPVGRQGEAAFAPAVKAKVPGETINSKFGPTPDVPGQDPGKKLTVVSCYSYSHSSGLFLGISVEGTVILQKPEDNKKYYGRPVSVKEILNGEIEKEDFDRNLHLLHQSLYLLAERIQDADYSRFDKTLGSSSIKIEYDSDEEMPGSTKMNRESLVFRRRLSEVLGDTERTSVEIDNTKRPNSFIPQVFSLIKQPDQPPNFAKMERYFTLRKKNTIIGDGIGKIKLIEYEWLVELKTLVIDSGFLFTYGMLSYSETLKKKKPDFFFDDFEYLMFALVARGKYHKSLKRMKKVMNYISKRKYQFRYFDLMSQSPEKAVAFEKWFYTCAVNVGPDVDGTTVLGIDLSFFKPEQFTDGREGELIQLLIWMIRVSLPDVASFRCGLSFMIDMEGSSKKNIPKTYMRNKLHKFLKLVATHFPMELKMIGLVRASNEKKLKAGLSSLGKVVIPAAVRSRVQVVGEGKLRRILPEESIPIAWGGTRVPFTETSFRKYLRNQGKRYVKTLKAIKKVQRDIDTEKLF